jgi:hypothetical protein
MFFFSHFYLIFPHDVCISNRSQTRHKTSDRKNNVTNIVSIITTITVTDDYFKVFATSNNLTKQHNKRKVINANNCTELNNLIKFINLDIIPMSYNTNIKKTHTHTQKQQILDSLIPSMMHTLLFFYKFIYLFIYLFLQMESTFEQSEVLNIFLTLFSSPHMLTHKHLSHTLSRSL